MSMLPAIYNMTGKKGIRQGRDFARSFRLPWATSPMLYEAAATDAKGEEAFEFLVLNDDIDTITLTLTDDDTADVATGTYNYDIKQTDSLNKVVNIVEGKVDLIRTSTT